MADKTERLERVLVFALTSPDSKSLWGRTSVEYTRDYLKYVNLGFEQVLSPNSNIACFVTDPCTRDRAQSIENNWIRPADTILHVVPAEKVERVEQIRPDIHDLLAPGDLNFDPYTLSEIMARDQSRVSVLNEILDVCREPDMIGYRFSRLANMTLVDFVQNLR